MIRVTLVNQHNHKERKSVLTDHVAGVSQLATLAKNKLRIKAKSFSVTSAPARHQPLHHPRLLVDGDTLYDDQLVYCSTAMPHPSTVVPPSPPAGDMARSDTAGTQQLPTDIVSLMGTYTANLMTDPRNPMYRRIKLADPHFARVWVTPGAADVFRGAGWVEGVEEGYLVLPAAEPADAFHAAVQSIQPVPAPAMPERGIERGISPAITSDNTTGSSCCSSTTTTGCKVMDLVSATTATSRSTPSSTTPDLDPTTPPAPSGSGGGGSKVILASFGYRYGSYAGRPHDQGGSDEQHQEHAGEWQVMRLTHLPGPGRNHTKQSTGMHRRLRKILLRHPAVQAVVTDAVDRVLEASEGPAGVPVVRMAFGCEHGKHRSVTVVEEVASRLSGKGYEVAVTHRDRVHWGKRDRHPIRESDSATMAVGFDHSTLGDQACGLGHSASTTKASNNKASNNKASTTKVSNNKASNKMVLFWHGPFSQFHSCSFRETDHDGQERVYACAEQYMMANKAKLFGDTDTLDAIMQTQSPRCHKQLGRMVRGFKQDVWNKHRCEIVTRGNMLKFGQNPELQQMLLSTGTRTLVEASPRDNIWGIGMGANDPRASDPSRWCGMNLLGQCLMRVRQALADQTQ